MKKLNFLIFKRFRLSNKYVGLIFSCYLLINICSINELLSVENSKLDDEYICEKNENVLTNNVIIKDNIINNDNLPQINKPMVLVPEKGWIDKIKKTINSFYNWISELLKLKKSKKYKQIEDALKHTKNNIKRGDKLLNKSQDLEWNGQKEVDKLEEIITTAQKEKKELNDEVNIWLDMTVNPNICPSILEEIEERKKKLKSLLANYNGQNAILIEKSRGAITDWKDYVIIPAGIAVAGITAAIKIFTFLKGAAESAVNFAKNFKKEVWRLGRIFLKNKTRIIRLVKVTIKECFWHPTKCKSLIAQALSEALDLFDSGKKNYDIVTDNKKTLWEKIEKISKDVIDEQTGLITYQEQINGLDEWAAKLQEKKDYEYAQKKCAEKKLKIENEIDKLLFLIKLPCITKEEWKCSALNDKKEKIEYCICDGKVYDSTIIEQLPLNKCEECINGEVKDVPDGTIPDPENPCIECINGEDTIAPDGTSCDSARYVCVGTKYRKWVEYICENGICISQSDNVLDTAKNCTYCKDGEFIPTYDPEYESCCNEEVITDALQHCCKDKDPNYPCDTDKMCCGGSCCDEENEICCDSICCQKDQSCCGENCCEEDQTCCDGICCKEDETCCNGVCCPEGEVCDDDGNCCAPDCSGVDCGDDGCGGSCGDCSECESCENGSCVPDDSLPCDDGDPCTKNDRCVNGICIGDPVTSAEDPNCGGGGGGN